jgi:4-hydroxy-tetrahydrodipicolinate reductase
MKVALLGYGKMGREIENILHERGHSIDFILNSKGKQKGDKIGEVDVAIEFSTPGTVIANITTCFDASVPIVTGTTGWDEHLNSVAKKCMDDNKTLFYASNFSIGVNIFFALNKKLAKIMDQHPEYNVSLDETHHEEKLDSPSGTAISLANEIISNISGKTKWVNEGDLNKEEVKINSYRIGQIPGTHAVNYESNIDAIDIKHTAKSRRGFAMGAVLASEWVQGKKGVFNMNDFLNI